MSSSTTSDAVVRVENLTKRYRLYGKPLYRFLDMYGLLWRPAGKFREHAAVADLSFEVRRGEKVAIIGRNGAGKSTLLRMICGVVTPTSGSLRVDGEIHALLSLGTGFHPDFTGRENVYSYLAHLGVVGLQADRRFAEILEFSELHEYIDQPVKTYSAGMGLRLMFSSATVITPDILVIDEVLGSGDAYFAKKSFERMKDLCERAGTTLLMVTHDLYSAAMFCERLIWIDRGVIIMDGPGKSVLRAYEESIREQEEQRLRSLRLATVAANVKGRRDDSDLLPAYLKQAPGDDAPPEFAVRRLRFFDGDNVLATLDVADADAHETATQAEGAFLILDSREGNWGELETIEGCPARRMLPYGSIFHKLPLIIASPGVARAAREGALSVEVGCFAGRRQRLEFAVLDPDGGVIAAQQFEVAPDGWQDVRAQLLRNDAQAPLPPSERRARHGQRAMQITNVRFVGSDGAERMHFAVGAAMRVKLSYRINRPDFAERPTMLAAFQQNGVIRSHRFWTDQILISSADGREGEIEIVADPLLLGAGAYFVTISVFQEGYLTSSAPKKFFAVSDGVYDMHARAYEIIVKPSATQPFCNDVIFQHPSLWYRNGQLATTSLPHVEALMEAEPELDSVQADGPGMATSDRAI
jgi:lipopolysaccharide transport system ATP-binding protein